MNKRAYLILVSHCCKRPVGYVYYVYTAWSPICQMTSCARFLRGFIFMALGSPEISHLDRGESSLLLYSDACC